MVRVVPKCELFDLPARTPVVLAGPPHRLKGRVALTNPTDQRIVINGGSLATAGGKSRDGDGLAGSAMLMAILRPGQATESSVTARVKAGTPPGLYKAQLVLGENSHPVELHVAESLDLTIVPDHIVVSAPPGSVAEASITAINEGNVPVTIGQFYGVVLDDDRMVCRTTRSTLAQAEKVTTIEQFLLTGAREANRHLTEMGVLGVAVEGGPVTVAPGASVRLPLKLRLPAGLQQGTRYTAILPLAMADLVFTLVPTPARGAPQISATESRS